tara:strand:+ start:290 stop:643 length:354 start_codon:yes stop_codon:yes gene_type:complete
MAIYPFFQSEKASLRVEPPSQEMFLANLKDELAQLQIVYQLELPEYEKQKNIMQRAKKRAEKSKDSTNVEKSLAFIAKNQSVLDKSKIRIKAVEGRIEMLMHQIEPLETLLIGIVAL